MLSFQVPDNSHAKLLKRSHNVVVKEGRNVLGLDGIGILFDFNRIKGKGIATNPTSTSHDVKKPESTAVLNDTEDKDMNKYSNSKEDSVTLTFAKAYVDTMPREEAVADVIGQMINDLNYVHTLALKMSHPLLAKIHEIINHIRMAF